MAALRFTTSLVVLVALLSAAAPALAEEGAPEYPMGEITPTKDPEAVADS